MPAEASWLSCRQSGNVPTGAQRAPASDMDLPNLPPVHSGRFLCAGNGTKRGSFGTARWRPLLGPGNDMPTPIPFADDGGTRAYRTNLQTWHAAPAPRFSIWRFLLAAAALPPLLVFLAAASWLTWICFQGAMGTPGAIIALVGIATLAALIRRHTGMAHSRRRGLILGRRPAG